jgi:tetratricopeptide (TPR) repeat protein
VPKFAYVAVDSAGKETKGIVEAASEAAAIKDLSRQGFFLEEIHAANITEEFREGIRHRVEHERQKKERQAQRRHNDARKRRQRLVVRFQDGHTENGICFALNAKEPSFHLDRVDENEVATGETVTVHFSDIKAVFYVKSFDGKFDKSFQYNEWSPEGGEIIVEFKDGEVIRGYCLHHYDPNVPRFSVIPEEENSNNISILVEATAVLGVYTPEEYKRRRVEKQQEVQKDEAGAKLTQEETMGDFYFETRNYDGALEQYEVAYQKFPKSKRLRKKTLYTKYNIGVSMIKRREYVKALEYMEEVMKFDPRNEKVRKKTHQLRKIVEKMERAKSERSQRG